MLLLDVLEFYGIDTITYGSLSPYLMLFTKVVLAS